MIEAKINERKKVKREAELETKRKKQERNKRIAAYLRQCTAARSIPPAYREDIDQIDCRYFKHYPKLMQRYIPLRIKHKTYVETFDDIKLEKVDKKIQKLLAPILNSLQKKRIACYEKAILKGDLMNCDGEYLSEIDSLLMTSWVTNYNDSMTRFGSKDAIEKLEKENKKRLTPEEKERAVSKLRETFKKEEIPIP